MLANATNGTANTTATVDLVAVGFPILVPLALCYGLSRFVLLSTGFRNVDVYFLRASKGFPEALQTALATRLCSIFFWLVYLAPFALSFLFGRLVIEDFVFVGQGFYFLCPSYMVCRCLPA